MTERLRLIVADAERQHPTHASDLRTGAIRQAARSAADALDSLAALPDEGDPRYAQWWVGLEWRASILAQHARAVVQGLAEDRAARAEARR